MAVEFLFPVCRSLQASAVPPVRAHATRAPPLRIGRVDTEQCLAPKESEHSFWDPVVALDRIRVSCSRSYNRKLYVNNDFRMFT